MLEPNGQASLDDARSAARALASPSPTEVALGDAERGPVRRRAVSPLGIVRNVKLARRVSLRALTADKVHLDTADTRVPVCERCEDTCCRGPGTGVSLRLSDLARLMDAGLAWAVAREQRWSPEDYERDPALKELEARDSQRRFPMLRRRDDGSCVFLDDNERCAIHPIRPLVCRAFPYRLDERKERVHFSKRCPSSREGGDAHEVAHMAATVLELYNAKIRDLVVLAHGRKELDRLGLSRHLPILD